MDKDLADQVVDIAQRVVASGAIFRERGRQRERTRAGAAEMYFTAGPSLAGQLRLVLVRSRHRRDLLESELPPTGRRRWPCTRPCTPITPMSAASCPPTRRMPPPTRSRTVRSECWVEALAMFGLATGVPVAGYGPRGSEQAIASVRASVTPGCPRCCWPTAACSCSTVPRAGRPGRRSRRGSRPAGMNAAALGGPVEIPAELRAAACSAHRASTRRNGARLTLLACVPDVIGCSPDVIGCVPGWDRIKGHAGAEAQGNSVTVGSTGADDGLVRRKAVISDPAPRVPRSDLRSSARSPALSRGGVAVTPRRAAAWQVTGSTTTWTGPSGSERGRVRLGQVGDQAAKAARRYCGGS